LEKNTGRRKSSRKFFNNCNSRPASAVGIHSTRNRQISNFCTVNNELLVSNQKETRLRIAKPPHNLISVSNHHWNQISHNWKNKNAHKEHKTPRKGTQKEDITNETGSFVGKIVDFGSSLVHGTSGKSKINHKI